MKCAYHPERDAAAACVNCGRLICAECKTVLGGKNYCEPCVNEMFAATKPSAVAGAPTEAPKAPVETVKKPATTAGMPSGLTKGAEESAGPIAQAPVAEGKVSGAWWLMPIFLVWVGGLVAWVVNKEKAPKKSRRMLFWGIGLTFLWPVVGLIISLIPALIASGILK